MPRFYFDTHDGETRVSDDQGLDLTDRQAAKVAAVDSLPDLARDVLPDGDRRTMAVHVRDATGRVILTATLSLRVDWV